MDLKNLIEKQQKTRELVANQSDNRTAKKSRNDQEGPFYETLATSLFEIWRKVQSDVRNDANSGKRIDISKIEIEIRVGHIVADFRRWKSQSNRKQICYLSDTQRADLGLTFKTGVDEFYVEHFKRVLTG